MDKINFLNTPVRNGNLKKFENFYKEKSNEDGKIFPEKILPNVEKSNAMDKRSIIKTENIDDRLRFSKNYNLIENQISINPITHNKSESFLYKENKERTMIKFPSRNMISKEKIFLNFNMSKENDQAREKNIQNSTNSHININFVKVHLPLILPNLPENKNLNTNSRVFRNNKIQKRKSTKKNTIHREHQIH